MQCLCIIERTIHSKLFGDFIIIECRTMSTHSVSINYFLNDEFIETQKFSKKIQYIPYSINKTHDKQTQ